MSGEHQRGHPSLDHGSAHDTLRWGDSHTFNNLQDLSGESSELLSKQQIAAHWRWPLSWNLWVAIIPQFEASETASFVIELQTTIGVGQAVATFPLRYTLSPTAGVYLPITDQKFLPGQDIQIITNVFNSTNTTGVNDNLTVALFIAPQTEPHAFTKMMDRLVHHESPDEVQWMPPGFYEAGMGYRR
jgi:hypothetical protein